MTYINYAITSHGLKMQDEYIELPSGIRVIMLCTNMLCPADFTHEKALYTLMMNDIDPELNKLEDIWYRTKNFNSYNYCVFSGNITDGFVDFLPVCKNRTFNFVPNLSFSAEGVAFRDGVYKLPMRPKLVSTQDNRVLSDSESLKNALNVLSEKKPGNSYANVFVDPTKEKAFNAKLEYDSYYITFHEKEEPNYPSINKLGIKTLKDLINHIKEQEDYYKRKCMITIFVSACISSANTINPHICMISLKNYNELKISVKYNDVDYNDITMSKYDTTIMNTGTLYKSFQKFISKFNFTFCHQLSGLRNELDPAVVDNFRIYKDGTTNAYVKNIMSDEKIRFLFLDYTFHTINSFVQSEVNSQLIKDDQIPLMQHEFVYAIFKGGNVMNYFMELHLTSIENIFTNVPLKNVKMHSPDIIPYTDPNNIEQTSSFGSFFLKLKENFRVSDVDYSVYIKASNYARFILIYGYVVLSISKALQHIAANFDMIFKGYIIPADELAGVTTTDTFDEKVHFPEHAEIKNVITNTKFKTYRDLIKDELVTSKLENVSNSLKQKNNNLDSEYLDQIITSIANGNNFISTIDEIVPDNFSKIYRLVEYIKYVQTLQYFKLKHMQTDLSKITSRLKNQLIKLVDKKFADIVTTQFYSPDKLNQIKNDLASVLSQLKGQIKYESYNNGLESLTNIYEITSDILATDLEYSERSNTIIKSANDHLNQQEIFESDESHTHYMTYNNIIKCVTPVNTLNFDLMRIKFNVNLINGKIKKNDKMTDIKIPSEFIDVSIPFYDDSFATKTLHDFKQTRISLRNKDIDRDIIVNSYSINDLNHDLQYVLFEQSYFTPWLDAKYDKRIIRLLFLSIVDAYNTDCINGNLPKKMAAYRKFLKFANILLTYVNDLTANTYPYKECGQFLLLNNYSEQNIKAEIDNTIPKYINLLFRQLLMINEEFHDLKSILIFLIIFSRLLTFDHEDVFKFFNKNRQDYLYVPYTREEFAKQFDSNKQKFKTMLHLIVDYGYKIYYVYSVLLYKRNIKVEKVGGYYEKYKREKQKYLARKYGKY